MKHLKQLEVRLIKVSSNTSKVAWLKKEKNNGILP
jgi:hypothetical protein